MELDEKDVVEEGKHYVRQQPWEGGASKVALSSPPEEVRQAGHDL
jgi:hypothetical protein